MKKVLISILILAQIIFIPSAVFAQTPTIPGQIPANQGTTPADQNSFSQPVKIPGQIGVPQSSPVNGFNGPQITDSQPTSGGSSVTTVNACSAIKFKSVLDILIWLKCIAVSILIPLIFAAAFVVFLWGVLKFMSASDPKKKKEGQQFIWYGLLGLFVMVSVWGILKIVGRTLGVDPIAVPLLQTDYLKQ